MIGFTSVGTAASEAYSDDEITYGARSSGGIRMQNVDTRDRIDRLDGIQSPAPGGSHQQLQSYSTRNRQQTAMGDVTHPDHNRPIRHPHHPFDPYVFAHYYLYKARSTSEQEPPTRDHSISRHFPATARRLSSTRQADRIYRIFDDRFEYLGSHEQISSERHIPMTTLQTPTTTHSAYPFDTDSQVDESGHAYLPFHPRSFGFPFGFEASSSGNNVGEIAARQASEILAGMLANPVDLAVGFGVGYGKVGERPTGLGVKGIDDDRDRAEGVRLWAHVDPAELNIDRRSSGASVEEGMDSASSSSRSVSPEPEIKMDGKTKRPNIKIDTDVPKRTGMVSAADEEMIVCVVPPKRGTRRKSSAVSTLLEEDEDVSERKSKKVKVSCSAGSLYDDLRVAWWY